jgi:MFS-type transporter involved in bile tolerance (Atg22 family)
MTTKFASRQNVVVILGAVMIVCLALTIVTFLVALIWIGQPLGNEGLVAADAFASVFSAAFFAAFALAMAEQRSRSSAVGFAPPAEPHGMSPP